jgi:hypothetical protein
MMNFIKAGFFLKNESLEKKNIIKFIIYSKYRYYNKLYKWYLRCHKDNNSIIVDFIFMLLIVYPYENFTFHLRKVITYSKVISQYLYLSSWKATTTYNTEVKKLNLVP